MKDSILFQLFYQLHQQGFPLGAADYLLVQEVVRSGLGLEDLEQFKRMLKLLWAKSLEEQKLLELEFDRWMKPHFSPVAKYSEGKLEEIEEFKLFCERLWSKCPEKKELFKQAFSKLVEPHLQENALPELPEAPTNVSPSPSDRGELVDEPIESVRLTQTPSVHPPINGPTRRLSLEQKKVEINYTLGSPSPLPDRPELVADSPSYQFTPRLPMNQREMAEIWRQLRRPQRLGRSEELDVECTIDSICRTGFLTHLVWRSRLRNQAQLVVLVDRQGSMAPFSLLVEGICESILRGGLRGRVSFYYFHDCPDTYLYKRPQLTGAIQLKTLLYEQIQGNSVLIISDAGAAYGFYDKERREATKTFLKDIQSYTYLYAWLNPLPEYRWTATTAEDIKQFVPMFPFNREGLHDTVNILRGYPFPPGVRLNG